MLLSLKDVFGYTILATDGQIGAVDDFLVDNESLRARYLVIDTGTWLPGRKVILATSWISSVEPARRMVVVNIDQKRIKESPEFDPDRPLDRAYEMRLHDHYRLPYYWV
jgi:uncharacterized protein YrrD